MLLKEKHGEGGRKITHRTCVKTYTIFYFPNVIYPYAIFSGEFPYVSSLSTSSSSFSPKEMRSCGKK